MKKIVPDYYNNFSCIADKCKHSCCIGWEIDIDKKTEEYYKSITSEFGEKLTENIAYEDDIPHFKLNEKERCPFLNNDNLCEIYINLGENHLCQICADHPRFRNFFDTRTEIGLGLTCEEAARIIITNKELVNLTCVEDTTDEYYSEDDDIFLNFRDNIFDIVQNRKKSFSERVLILHDKFCLPELSLSSEKLTELFLSLEILDPLWIKKIKQLKNCSYQAFSDISLSLPYEQLLIYFLYRHLPDAQYDGLYKERINFSILSVMVIDMLYHVHLCSNIDDLIDFSRMYSSEIEYCEENIIKVLEFLKPEE